MQTLSKNFNFGKIDFTGRGRKINEVTVMVELRYKYDNTVMFSASGRIWNGKHTDTICGGQCLDTIKEYINNPIFTAIYRMWKLYHLNNMHAGTPKQEKLLLMAGICENDYDYDAACKYLESVGLLDDNGIRYGARWNYEPIPLDDLKEIEKLINGSEDK